MNFCPPMVAWTIRPFFGSVKTATPCLYLAAFDAPSAAATALTSALISKFQALKSLSALGVSKKITSAKVCPPAWAPMLACVIVASPVICLFS